MWAVLTKICRYLQRKVAYKFVHQNVLAFIKAVGFEGGGAYSFNHCYGLQRSQQL